MKPHRGEYSHHSPKPRRGISFGTILMVALTVMVLAGAGSVLPRLMGSADLDVDVGGMLSALSLDGALPELTLSDIPLTNATEVPAVSVTPEALSATPVPSFTPVPTATPVPGGTITLTIGGSVNIDDGIRKSAYYSESDKYDFTEIMSLLEDEMSSDLTLVTLENIALGSEKVSALNAPESVMDMLEAAGVDVVALGFSKAMDMGMAGLAATIDAAEERGLSVIGAYATQTAADAQFTFSKNNVDVAILHYTESISSTGKKAISNEGTPYALPTILISGSAEGMLADVRQARENGADVVVVSLNWGKVSSSKPTSDQREIAQQLANAGADVIVGAGSRVVQPVEWLTVKDENGSIRHTLCAWSLGSLINDSRKDGNVVGMLLQLQIAFDGDSISFERVCYTPTYIWRFKQDGAYQYRIAVSDQSAPDGMDDAQQGYMEKAFRNIQKYLEDSDVTLRQK